MTNLVIRKATLDDLNILLRFEQNIIEAERPFDPTLKAGEIHYYDLKQIISAAHAEVIIAELEGQLVGSGFARIEKAKTYLEFEKYAYLGFMYVEPKHRGKGINHQIIEALKSWAATQGVTEIRLEVYHNNLAAVNAYKKSGFVEHLVEMRMRVEIKD